MQSVCVKLTSANITLHDVGAKLDEALQWRKNARQRTDRKLPDLAAQSQRSHKTKRQQNKQISGDAWTSRSSGFPDVGW